MTNTESLWRFRVILAAGMLYFPLSCADTSPLCGNESDILFYRVFLDQECADCIELEFSSPILSSGIIRVPERPDHVVGRCGVTKVLTFGETVTLVLAPEEHGPLDRFREQLISTSKNVPVLIRLEGSSFPGTVKFAEEVMTVLTLFDFESEAQVERFLDDLKPTMVPSRFKQRPQEPGERESSAQEAATRLLRDFEEQDLTLEEIEAAYQRGADDETIQDLLEQLELPEPRD